MVAAEVFREKAREMEKSVFSFFVRNGHMTILALVAVVFGGLLAISTMPIESEPEVKIPIGTVMTVYPGASPSDVEKLVTDEIEDRLINLDDLKELTSETREGVSFITVEFDASADLEDAIRNLRDEVDAAKVDLPQDAEDPVVQQIRADDRAILTFTMVGELPFDELKQYADDFQDLIEDIPGVNKVEVNGLPDKEMQVLVRKEVLEGYQLSIADITSAIARNHIDFPVGSVLSNDLYYQTSLKGQFTSAESLASLAVGSAGGQTIYLRDIADVREVFAETNTESTLYEADRKIERTAVTFGVYKKVGADLVAIADNAKDEAKQFAEGLPAGAEVLVTDDESERIRQDISNLLRSAWQTVVIIAVVLLLALGLGEAVSAASSIPILYLISFVGLWWIGSTFNFLTFFALILSLGVVVDTSIVIIEGMYEHMKDHGMNSRQAALASLATFKAPLISGSATTIAAFLPLGLMTGIMGEYVKYIPYTVNITLLASLFTALMILPAVAAFLLRNAHVEGKKKPPKLTPVFQRLGAWFELQITTLLDSPKLQKRWLIGLPAAFVLSLALFVTGIVKFNLFSSVDTDVFFVTVKAAEGTALEKTKELTHDVESVIATIPELERYVVVYGSNGSHQSRITVTLTDPKERKQKSYDIAQQLRENLQPLKQATVLVEELEAGPPSGSDIEMRLIGEDIRSLEEFSAVVERQLRQTPGTSDVQNDLELSPGEFHILLKRDRMEYFGISAQELGQVLRTSVFGNDSVKINEAGDETPIVVSLDYRDPLCVQNTETALIERRDHVTLCRSNPNSIADIENLLVATRRGQVPLSELVDTELTSAVTAVRHFDTKRVVRVKANVVEGFVLQDVLTAFRERMDNITMPSDIQIQFGGENEDTMDSMRSLGRASILAMLIILTILVYQFKSFRQVFIIMMTMPLAIMGVFYGLALIRIPLSFPGMIGVVALLGIVVNDAIVMIDKININRHDVGMPIRDAVIKGSIQRLEPVIMTTLTTALGVLPLVFTGETFRDLAIVVAIGITVATIFTLFVIPLLYYRFESNQPGVLQWIAGKAKRLWLRLQSSNE